MKIVSPRTIQLTEIMKLDRNINPDRKGKYALILLRKVDGIRSNTAAHKLICDALNLLHSNHILDYGNTDESEFFVIRLKDKYAADALAAYSSSALMDGQPEWSDEVQKLSDKANSHPNQKQPD